MQHSPPSLFKQEPPAFARLIVFIALAFCLLISDVRYRTLEAFRQAIGAGMYPVQRAVLAPRNIAVSISSFFITFTALRVENQALKTRNLKLALQAQQAAQLNTENVHLRALLQLKPRQAIGAVLAEIQYDVPNPFTQKVIIDRGNQHSVQAGSPVINEHGVIGQVTRVYPLHAEVTLLTDKDQAIPIQFLRTSFRSVIYGAPRDHALELRFIPQNTDIKPGDRLVTSGLDGVFPAGLPVATVLRIERHDDIEFVRVVCAPFTPVRGARQVLVLNYKKPAPINATDVVAQAQ